MGDYSGMETFAMWFCIIFYGGIVLAFVGGSIGLYLEWKDVRKKVYAKKTETSDDYRIERERVLSIIEDRIKGDIYLLPDKERGDWGSLKDSSEVASLFRYAHFAGYHLTFEQNECEWSTDPEYLDPDVFKTDMKEAAALRGEQEWSGYKRYFDPPRSPRDKALGRNIS